MALSATGQPTQAERAIAGDSEAVRALWETHRRWLAAVTLAHMPRAHKQGDPELEDLLQEVAVRVVRTIHTVQDPAALRPWLRTIAVNVARTAGRRRIPRLRLIRSEASAPTPMGELAGREQGESHAGSGSLEEGRRALAAAQRLAPEYAEPLFLRCVRGMSYKQIADVLGVPVTTIETRLARARRMLREELAGAPGAGVQAETKPTKETTHDTNA